MLTKISVLDVISYNFKEDPELVANLSGGLWSSNIPETEEGLAVSIPYGRLELESCDYEWCMSKHNNGHSCLEHSKVSIILFDNQVEKITSLLNLLESKFNWALFTIPPSDNSTKFIHIYPLRKSSGAEFFRDKEGNQIYTGTILFECSLFRQ
jgi:hypothetical protein